MFWQGIRQRRFETALIQRKAEEAAAAVWNDVYANCLHLPLAQAEGYCQTLLRLRLAETLSGGESQLADRIVRCGVQNCINRLVSRPIASVPIVGKAA